MMQGKLFASAAFALGLLGIAGFAAHAPRANAANATATAAAQCDRACLGHIMDEYIAALLKHDPSSLPVAENLKSTENTKPTPLGQGVWKTIQFMKFRGETVADPSTGQVTYW
ncbi:MAG: hypothetical protein WAN97_18470, partial [Candidatus Acidiferrales bacterium]